MLDDVVQRLGVDYHFEKEMRALEELYHEHCADDRNLCNGLCDFGCLDSKDTCSCDIFIKFKDERGKFKESLINDVSGMLSLYEAAHIGIRGEDVLDEAIAFTKAHLESMVTQVSAELAEQITRALNRPIRKGLPRMEARHYINIYSGDANPQNRTILKFATLDFNMLQVQHQKELSSITKWWKSLDVETKLPYARDRIVELYFWIMGVYFEPQYALARRILTKVIAIASLLDDTYDAYGTREELELFTDAIKRWDNSTIDVLPEYMKLIYQALLDVYTEAEEEISKEGRSYCIDYAIEEMKTLVQAYFVEAKWCNEGYIPTVEEYLKVSLVTTTYKMLATTSFLGMGQIADKKAFDWLANDPKIITASTIICRLMDDIVSHKFEQKRKHVASGVECYMIQHGVSEEEVIKLFSKEISNAWKDTNQEFLKPTAVPAPLLKRILNLSRAMDIIYKDDDTYTNSYKLKKDIASLLVNPISLEV
ncbi:alpha-copaene synthase-like [Pistacia vera]|uniref:alpha-copaene synthase-like n=1 Tax=Pistacia vera TaxID=55513 RepID=UPI0012630F3A|nr:alpha-copaene synthase-like [Pistacia vera]